MMRVLRWLVLLAVIGAGGVWVLSWPKPLSDADVAGLTGDATRGEAVFWAAGCASCHMAPEAKAEAQLVLVGGQRFPSDFGTFIAPNISQDPQAGIGGWSLLDLASALKRGVSPEGTHYYPALPYASYARMQMQDVADLHVFLQTLPADPTPSQPHEIGFPFSSRLPEPPSFTANSAASASGAFARRYWTPLNTESVSSPQVSASLIVRLGR